MKIFLTAPPETGKSTVIEKFLRDYDGDCRGIVARELRGSDGQRIGFTSFNEAGQSRQFMFRVEEPGEDCVGDFRVDVQAVDEFVVPEIASALADQAGKKSNSADGDLIYVDEIGRAQAKSNAFLSTLRALISCDCNLLASVVYEDEPWSLEFKRNPRVCIIEVTQQNRDELPPLLLSAFGNWKAFASLTEAQQQQVNAMFGEFVREAKYVSARKLFDNAIHYVGEDRIKKVEQSGHERRFVIAGKTRGHELIWNSEENRMSCDCDLSNGRGRFRFTAQTCSHEMSIMLDRDRFLV